MRKNRRFDWREKARDFLIEEWPTVAAIMLIASAIINFILFL